MHVFACACVCLGAGTTDIRTTFSQQRAGYRFSLHQSSCCCAAVLHSSPMPNRPAPCVLLLPTPGPLVFLLLGLGAFLGYTRGGLTGKAAAKGRWVYDRSLGGKKVRLSGGTLWH